MKHTSKQEKPWYLKKRFIYIVTFLAPPVAFLNILLNRKEWEREEMLEYLTIATASLAVWIMRKFVPFNLFMLTVLPVVFIILIIYGNRED